jgi:hypothetical protein
MLHQGFHRERSLRRQLATGIRVSPIAEALHLVQVRSCTRHLKDGVSAKGEASSANTQAVYPIVEHRVLEDSVNQDAEIIRTLPPKKEAMRCLFIDRIVPVVIHSGHDVAM